MGYIAVRGGEKAIENSIQFLEHKRSAGGSPPVSISQIRDQLHFLVDRVMGEGSLYAPDLAALAIKQSAGDAFEAAFMVRAYRATLERLAYSIPSETRDMRICRRISAAFQEIPGGQILGPSSDYTLRLLDFSLCNEMKGEVKDTWLQFLKETGLRDEIPETLPKIVDMLRRQNLVATRERSAGLKPAITDITRDAIQFPSDRSATLQTMARGETGGMLALAYSNMRGYGTAHPTIGEIRTGWIPVFVQHPFTAKRVEAGQIPVTEAEIISKINADSKDPKFEIGYGLCFGNNEIKAISMATLDAAMQNGESRYPSEDQEFVLTHIDGIEAMGFANHFKLPHYVTFQSELDMLRSSRKKIEKKAENMQPDRENNHDSQL